MENTSYELLTVSHIRNITHISFRDKGTDMATPTQMDGFLKGDKIQHATWGDGIVTGNDGEFVRVRYERFENGRRVRGIYDAAWFYAHPTGLLRKNP